MSVRTERGCHFCQESQCYWSLALSAKCTIKGFGQELGMFGNIEPGRASILELGEVLRKALIPDGPDFASPQFLRSTLITFLCEKIHFNALLSPAVLQ